MITVTMTSQEPNAYRHSFAAALLCAVLCALSSSAGAQQLVLERQVIGNTGRSIAADGTFIQYTVGEAVIRALSHSSLLLTQGFHQPEIRVTPQVPQLPLIQDFVVFPNPASTYTTIRFNLYTPGNIRFLLVNNAGQIVYRDERNLAAGTVEIRIPLEHYASGMYYVVLSVGANTKYTEKLIIQ